MMFRHPASMHPEALKLMMEEQERRAVERAKRRKARLLAREINRAVEQYDKPEEPELHTFWRFPQGLTLHALAMLILAGCSLVVSALIVLAARLFT